MRRILLYTLLTLSMVVCAQDSKKGLVIFDLPTETLDSKSFEVTHAMDRGFAMARPERGLMDVLLFLDGRYFYDCQIVRVPEGKQAWVIGVYRFPERDKTVPVIQFIDAPKTPARVQMNEVDDEKIYDVVEQMPQFPGGPSALFEYISKNLKYSEEAENKLIQGRVIVTFTVEKDGSITDAKVSKSVEESLDNEAIRIVYSMPRWNPGRQNGNPVRVKYTVPITFRLQ